MIYLAYSQTTTLLTGTWHIDNQLPSLRYMTSFSLGKSLPVGFSLGYRMTALAFVEIVAVDSYHKYLKYIIQC